MTLHEGGGPPAVAGPEGVVDGPIEVIVGLEDLRCPMVQGRQAGRVASGEPGGQQLAEQVVEAIPGCFGIQRN